MEPVTTIKPVADADPTPATPRTGLSGRLLGAVVGAVLGLATFAAIIVVGRVTGLAESPALALVAGEEGILSPTGGAPLAWLVPPLAAAIAGALDGPAATRGVSWVGTWMGFMTYLVGVVIGGVLLVGVLAGETTSASSSPLGLLTGIPFLLLAGAVVLAPLLIVCLALGLVWAAVLRRVAGGGPAASDGGRPVLLVAIVGAVLAVLWLIWSFIISALVSTQTV